MGVTVKSAVWKDELTDVSKKNEEFFVMVGFTKTQSKVFSDCSNSHSTTEEIGLPKTLHSF